MVGFEAMEMHHSDLLQVANENAPETPAATKIFIDQRSQILKFITYVCPEAMIFMLLPGRG